MIKKCVLPLLALTFASIGYSAENVSDEKLRALLPQLEQFIQEGMKESHVPGLAIAIVHNGKTLYVNGFGYRNLKNKEKVTDDTIFQLASLSKPITSTILARLVAEGKIDWESKIADLNPDFRLSDPWVTSQVTLKDFLSHRSGLPDHAGDILEDLGYSEEEILYRLRYITPLHSFRDYYAYTNFGFSEAAFSVSHKLNTPWNKLAEKNLFEPLGMSATSYSFDEYANSPNKATTYFIENDEAHELSVPRNPDAQRPAGGASSTAQDIAKWMILQLSGNESIDATHRPVIVTGINSKTGRPTFYGMGWDVSFDEEGRSFVKHSGSFYLGVRTQVVLLPDEKIGIAIITNANPTALPEAISQTFLDLLFKGEITDGIVSQYNKLWMEHQVDPQVSYKVNKEDYSPPLPLEKYTGSYSNNYFGNISIEEKNNQLQLTIGSKTFPLKHLNRDVFTFETQGENRVGETQVIFSVDESNTIRQITIDYLNKFGMGTFTPE